MITGIKVLFLLSLVGTLLSILVAGIALLASVPFPGVAFGNIAAWLILFLVISGGITTLYYYAMQWNQVCRWILIALYGLLIVIELISSLIEINTALLPGLVLLRTLLAVALAGLVIWLFVCPTAQRLYLYNQAH